MGLKVEQDPLCLEPGVEHWKIVEVLGSVGATVLLSKVTVLAAPAMLYPLWNPWIRAGIRNLDLFAKQFNCLGLWKAVVIEAPAPEAFPFPNMLGAGRFVFVTGEDYVESQHLWKADVIEAPAPEVFPFPTMLGAGRYQQPSAVARIVVGEPYEGGARAVLEFPYQPACADIFEGDPVELLVLGKDPSFRQLKVDKWLADYPFVARMPFLQISNQIDQERQAEAAYAAQAAYEAEPMYEGDASYEGEPFTKSAQEWNEGSL
eukprot:gene1839-33257_t